MANPTLLQFIQNLALGVKGKRWTDYTLVPSITLLVFDWLLTLDLEVSLVWNSPKSGIKLLFFLTRYLPFVDIPMVFYYELGYTLPQRTCEMTFKVFNWMFMIGHCSAILMLTLRTWAVCGKSRLSTYGLFGAFGLTIIAIAILTEFAVKVLTFEASPVPRLFGCICRAKSPKYLAFIYFIFMFYDGGLLLLMIVQAVYAFKIGPRLQLTTVVFRDGILYYIYIFGLSLLNAVTILTFSDNYKAILVPIQRVIQSILACRVVLHIREQGEAEIQGSTAPSEQMTESLRFAHTGQGTSFITTDVNE